MDMQRDIRTYRNRYPHPLAECILQANKNKTTSVPSGTGSAGLTRGWRRPTAATAEGKPQGASRISTYQMQNHMKSHGNLRKIIRNPMKSNAKSYERL